MSIIKPELRSILPGEGYKVDQIANDTFEIIFDNFSVIETFLHLRDQVRLARDKVTFEDLENYFNVFRKVRVNFGDRDYQIIKIRKINDKIVFKVDGIFVKPKFKDAKIRIKAAVPIAQNVKACGPVRFTIQNPFTFPIYESYALPNADTTYNKNGTISLINKGAIFWYTPTQTTVNKILGFKYILVNIPTADFVPVNCKITVANSNIYYGWFNTDPKYKDQYVDFYIYQEQVNNYLYKFTVKKSTFFTNTTFPRQKDVAIP